LDLWVSRDTHSSIDCTLGTPKTSVAEVLDSPSARMPIAQGVGSYPSHCFPILRCPLLSITDTDTTLTLESDTAQHPRSLAGGSLEAGSGLYCNLGTRIDSNLCNPATQQPSKGILMQPAVPNAFSPCSSPFRISAAQYPKCLGRTRASVSKISSPASRSSWKPRLTQ